MKRLASWMAVSGLSGVLGIGAIAAAQAAPPASSPSSYLYVWAGEMNVAAKFPPGSAHSKGARRGRDFLAVIDVAPESPRYGQLVRMLPVGIPALMPHHTHYEMPADGMLFANDFDADHTFIFNLKEPLHPTVKASFGDAGPYSHPHSFQLLPNGNTLATFQQKGSNDSAAGALVELDPQGRVVRASASADQKVDGFIRPYSLAVVPSLDRVVTSSADMYSKGVSHVIQVWRLSDLKLLKTVVLPGSDRTPLVGLNSAEPRVLADGRTVLVSTFLCGLYRVDGLAGTDPSASLVYDFGGRDCSVPVVAGHYWIEALQSSHRIASLDVSDPSHPVEVGSLMLGPSDLPHWLALEPGGNRIVITGYGGLFYRLLIARVDMQTGKLGLDESFREPGAKEPGFSFDRRWPDGWNGPAIAHGAVFSRPEKVSQASN